MGRKYKAREKKVITAEETLVKVTVKIQALNTKI